MSPFVNIGNVPFDMNILASVFPNCGYIAEKAQALETAGRIVRLKKGYYVASAEETGIALSNRLIANHLYGPSYVSLETALRYYGLIPERVYKINSMTTKHSRVFENPTGIYSYQHCEPEYFHLGITMKNENEGSFLIAAPEKALCDVINYSKNLNLRFMKDVRIYLEEDIRFDIDYLKKMDVNLIREIAKYSRKQQSINTLIKFMCHE